MPLVVCRALSTAPAAWWGLRCAFTFLAELLHIRPVMGRDGWAAAITGSAGPAWDVERRFRVTEVALAIMWVSGSSVERYSPVCTHSAPYKAVFDCETPRADSFLRCKVLCICIPIVLLCRLYDVPMVSCLPIYTRALLGPDR